MRLTGAVGLGHRHDHGHDHHHPVAGPSNARRLAVVLGLTVAYAVVEAVGGLLTGSLALLADAGHMLSDAMALGLALGATWLARRPATARLSFGYRRTEILAALANGVALVAIAIWIMFEASGRFADPPDVDAGPVLAVAAVGLVVNAIGAAVLFRARERSLNMRAAFLHLLADLLGTAGVIVAAVVILATGWLAADPLVSVVIGVLVLASAWGVLRDSVGVLLEGTPPGVDADEVGRRMVGLPGVMEVHDLHIWTITSGFSALSAHVLVGRDDDCHARRREVEALLRSEYGVTHTTLQVEHALTPDRLLEIPTPTDTDG
jgi:cobalt-zinc-cadmium efflux system protein